MKDIGGPWQSVGPKSGSRFWENPMLKQKEVQPIAQALGPFQPLTAAASGPALIGVRPLRWPESP
jgi:hypothetical protein